MKHLLDATEDWQKILKNSYVFLFLDYDGTLTPICDKPWRAKLSSSTKKILRDLASLDDVKVAIVSGRSLEDVKKLIGIPDLIYVGNHGLEIKGPRISYTHPDALEKERLFQEAAELLKKQIRVKGIIIENKRFGVTVHYRLAPKERVEFVKMVFLRVIQPYLVDGCMIVSEGKKVWEIRPALVWNKGTAVSWLLARSLAYLGKQAIPIYIGDDRTDENALEKIGGSGIGVKVTSHFDEPTNAEYFLLSPSEVLDFLKRIKELKQMEQSGRKNYAGSRR